MQKLKKEKRNLAKTLFLIFFYPLFFFSKKLNAHFEKSDFEESTGFSNYGWPSKFEKIFRWINANPVMKGNGVSYTPLSALEGMIVPNGLHFERHHYGIKEINPKNYNLRLEGNLEFAKNFSLFELRKMDLVSKKIFIECSANSNSLYNPQPIQTSVDLIHGLISCSEWTGIRIKDLLERVKVKGSEKTDWLEFESYDNGNYNISIPIEEARKHGFLALFQNGEPIRPEQGYPVRLIMPGWEGSTHVKWLKRITFRSGPVFSRNETSRYSDLLPSGKARQFSFLMECKSIILKPSPGKKILPGKQNISGLAWSGRGKISKVDVSIDGGKSWKKSTLQKTDSKSNIVRFNFKFEWQNEEIIIQSRCMDSKKNIQPSRQKFLKNMGKNAFNHFNAISSWKINNDGTVIHVYK